ncbi:MAG: hypothetical protein R3192_09630 [Woeseiaceae bacterium]|nr:hypothetical protein [Woeseiaceae bacterium]
MKDRPYLIVSGLLFSLVALAHLLRLAYKVPLQVGEWSVPLWPSAVAVIVTFSLLVWAFRLARLEQ